MPALPLRVALIGCGTISKMLYRPALRYLEDLGLARLVCLVDPVAENFESFRPLFPNAVYDQKPDVPVDLAIIAAPAPFHAPLTQQWLDRGASILCEKPMAPTGADCRQMIAAAERAGKVLSVGHVRRFYPVVEEIRRLIMENVHGRLIDFRFVEGSKFSWPIRTGDLFLPGKFGGVMADNGVHMADLIGYWFGSGFTIHYEDDAYGGVEANCQGVLTRRDLMGEFRISREVDTQNAYWLVFEQAAIEWRPTEPSRYTLIERHAGPTRHVVIAPEKSFERCFADQLKDVIDAVHSRRPPRVGGREGLDAVEFVDRCYSGRYLLSTDWMSQKETAAVEKIVRNV